MGENGEIFHFLGKTRKWYRYQRVVTVPLCRGGVVPVPVPIDNKGLVPVTVKVIPVPLLLATLFLHAMQF